MKVFSIVAFVFQRFTGNQIAKIFQQKREEYEETEVCTVPLYLVSFPDSWYGD